MNPHIFAGTQPLRFSRVDSQGDWTPWDGEAFYRIANHDRLRPFFLSLVSAGDHWLFVSSTGALTAGRWNADHALFPYYTEDKIHDSAGITGARTLLLARRGGRWFLWQPFADEHRGLYRLRRNLLKNVAGTRLLFEEINEDLALTFRYEWSTCQRFGFVRRAWLTNDGPPGRVRLLDGLQNLLPAGLTAPFQLEKSVLADAYKKNELLPDTGLGLLTLSSVPVDRPEPAESLRATAAWCVGLRPRAVLLCTRQLDAFRRGESLRTETDVRAERGAYFVQADLSLRRGQTAEWLIGADVERGPSDVAELNTLLRSPARLRRLVAADVQRNTQEVRRLVAAADGLQRTARPMADARHFGNVLFNIMRGGVFERGYEVDPEDLRARVAHANRPLATRHAAFFRGLKPGLTYRQLVAAAVATGNPHLERLCREYLPLTFSRRHGDPSRPWNRFSIAPLRADGRRAFWYEGNWRDLFQNWEALARSFPGFASGMVCRFLNASTADGYNPYRVTRDGIEWEVTDPRDPWSFIGYWGDHQIIYLLKLLEIVESHEPGLLRAWLTRPMFAYANVPYRIKPYAELLRNPRDTVLFDEAAERAVAERVRQVGVDGKLVWDSRGRVLLVTLAEKLLVPVLAKLSNFIPEAGIWLNTQRPEWNDANNALVGNGASVVTLCHLRRHLAFLRRLFGGAADASAGQAALDSINTPLQRGGCGAESGETVLTVSIRGTKPLKRFSCVASQRTPLKRGVNELREGAGEAGAAMLDELRLSVEVADFLVAIHQTLERHGRLLAGKISDADRKRVLDALGRAGSAYRQRLYQHGLSGTTRSVRAAEVRAFLDVALAWLDHSIRANRRPDGLFHAYNLVSFERPGVLPIRRLYLMLEGQVAALSSGCLAAGESLRLLRALRQSALYRADQHSYLLYPDRRLPRFVEKNNLPPRAVARSALLRRLVADGNRVLIERDVTGRFHFHGSIRNANDVRRKLDELSAAGYARLVRRDTRLVLQIFEEVFDHQSFTGRSGTFFGYEGLGCIYWHMVSKLLLAAQEAFFRAVESGASAGVRCKLAECYQDLRAGLGDRKTPASYGAFPMDPYSHTPGQGGARQPGLTGQVKEDILCRWGELGVIVEAGRIRFRPLLLRPEEFLSAREEFSYFDGAGKERRLRLPASSLAFTYCQVPMVYRLGDRNSLTVFRSDGSRLEQDGLELDEATCRSVFERTGDIRRIEIWLRR